MGGDPNPAPRRLGREAVRAIIGTDCSENEMVVGLLPGREVEAGSLAPAGLSE